MDMSGIIPPMVKFTLFVDDLHKIDIDLEGLSTGYYTGHIGEEAHQVVAESWKYAYVKYPIDKDITVTYNGSLFGSRAKVLCIDRAFKILNTASAPTNTDYKSSISELKFKAPAGTYAFMVPYATTGVNKKPFSLQIGEEIDITRDVKNWDEVVVSSERDGTTGIIKDVVFPIIISHSKRRAFETDAFDIIRQQWDLYNIYARVGVNIYLRDYIEFTYTFAKTIYLDFKSFDLDWVKNQIKISAINDELREAINAKGNTNYDILVEDVKEEKQFSYEPILFECSGKMGFLAEDWTPSDRVNEKTIIAFMNTYPIKAETIESRSAIEFRTQNFAYYQRAETKDQEYFMKVHGVSGTDEDGELEEDNGIEVSFNMKFHVKLWAARTGGFNSPEAWVNLAKRSKDGTIEVIHSQIMEKDLPDHQVYFDSDFACDKTVTLYKGDIVQLYCECHLDYTGILGYRLTAFQKRFNNLEGVTYTVKWTQKSQNGTIPINVVKPETLIQALLDRIKPGRFTCSIAWENPGGYTSLLAAAESIRDYKKAYFHTSLNDILDWLEVKGYSYAMENNEIVLKKRERFFDKNNVSLELKRHEVTNFREQANKEYAYTGIEIGYEKQEYDNVNGKFEINGKFSYDTGYFNNEEKVLSLISPVRADAYGIEFLTWYRFEETKDSDSDNDVFEFAAVQNADEGYGFYKDVYQKVNYAGGYSTNIYNAILNPYFLTKESEAFFGIFSKKLTLSSTTNNRTGIVYDGTEEVNIYQDYLLTKKLFDPIIYYLDVFTRNQLPLDLNGIITFPFHGELEMQYYKGYLLELERDYTRDKPTLWTFLALKE